MHWNYRVFRYKDGSVGVHEAYYDTLTGEPNGWTEQPIIVGDSVKDLLDILKMIKKDILKDAPIIDYDKTT